MNPPISGQYMARTLHAGVQRDLLAGRGERPRHLQAALLAKHELQLARRSQALGMIGAIRGAGARARHRAKQVLAEEAVLAADPRRPHAAVRHSRSFLQEARPRRRPSKPTSPPRCNDDFRKSQEVHIRRNTCKQRQLSKARANSAGFGRADGGQGRAPARDSPGEPRGKRTRALRRLRPLVSAAR